jgi:hypothetical protein
MMKADTEGRRGQRTVKAGSFGILKDFNFNEAAPLNNTLFVTTTTNIDRGSGTVDLSIPEINPLVHLITPKGATRFRLTAGAALVSLDNEMETSSTQIAQSGYESVTTTVAPMVLTSSLPANAISPILLVFGVSFYLEVNGVYYPQYGAFNSLSIVAVNPA